MKSTATDLDLVRRVKLGERHAFDMLVVKHRRKLSHVISRYLKLPQQIEDVVQETFIKAYCGIKAFRGGSQFSTWLHRVGVNAAIDFLVSERRRIPLYRPPSNTNTNEPIVLEIVDDEDPERIIEARQICKTVSNALKKLPEELRAAISLRDIDGFSYEEIASIMGCPIGTVRSRIFRARKSMAAILQP